MTIAGLMESIVPMDDDLCSERRALWKAPVRLDQIIKASTPQEVATLGWHTGSLKVDWVVLCIEVVPLLGDAIAQLRHDDLIDESFANKWLDTFLLARISTEMLTLHFMEMQECYVAHEGGDTSVCTGIVDRKCDPVAICQKAVDHVKGLADEDECIDYNDVSFIVEGNHCTASQGKIEFSFLPRYLLLLTEELLKNSAYATVINRGDDDKGLEPFPVTVTVGSNQQQVVIKISDRGGGISEVSAEKLWSYSWSRRLSGFVKPLTQLASFDDPLEGLKQQRLGMGLPLCRLYTKYMGGSLQLMSVPGVGVDTYLVLSRIALYFAWMNHFTLWLLAPAGVGVAAYCRMNFFGYTVDDDPYLPFHSLFVVFWRQHREEYRMSSIAERMLPPQLGPAVLGAFLALERPWHRAPDRSQAGGVSSRVSWRASPKPGDRSAGEVLSLSKPDLGLHRVCGGDLHDAGGGLLRDDLLLEPPGLHGRTGDFFREVFLHSSPGAPCTSGRDLRSESDRHIRCIEHPASGSRA
ncbi:BCKDK [Symbiodinium sp. KB8]|nr:BCKDK [Symbiodinium sp. KB8]